jgi:hypothetical protein
VYFQLWTAILLWTDCAIQHIRPVSVLQLYFGLHLRHRSESIAPERTKDSNLTSTGKRTASIFGVGVLHCAIPRCAKQVGFVDSRCCDGGCWSARPVPTHSTMMCLTQPLTISLTEETSCQCSPLFLSSGSHIPVILSKKMLQETNTGTTPVPAQLSMGDRSLGEKSVCPVALEPGRFRRCTRSCTPAGKQQHC